MTLLQILMRFFHFVVIHTNVALLHMLMRIIHFVVIHTNVGLPFASVLLYEFYPFGHYSAHVHLSVIGKQ